MKMSYVWWWLIPSLLHVGSDLLLPRRFRSKMLSDIYILCSKSNKSKDRRESPPLVDILL